MGTFAATLEGKVRTVTEDPVDGALSDLRNDRPLLERESAAERVAAVLISRIAEGYFRPGNRLPEGALVGALGVSRNTLREAFRLLAHQRLVVHELNRGVFVRRPTVEDVEDLYRARRVIECAAVRGVGEPLPDLAPLRAAVKLGRAAHRRRNWQELGTADIRFHEGLAALYGSPRVNEVMDGLLAELRLVFHVMEDPKRFHEPYLERNIQILGELEQGEGRRAERLLAAYLDDARDQLVEAYPRRTPD